MSDQQINLTSATRTNLLSLQDTQSLIGRTQQRLATGLKVNSALDDALAFFKARNLNARASDLSTIKNGITGAISVITAATQGLTAMESTLQQMKALATSAIASPESSTRASLASQFNELRSQVDGLAEDSSFNGVNLLKNSIAKFQPGGDYLTVKFNEQTQPLGDQSAGHQRPEGERLQFDPGDVGQSHRHRRLDHRVGPDRYRGDQRHQCGDLRPRFGARHRAQRLVHLRYAVVDAVDPQRLHHQSGQYAAGWRVRSRQCRPERRSRPTCCRCKRASSSAPYRCRSRSNPSRRSCACSKARASPPVRSLHTRAVQTAAPGRSAVCGGRERNGAILAIRFMVLRPSDDGLLGFRGPLQPYR